MMVMMMVMTMVMMMVMMMMMVPIIHPISDCTISQYSDGSKKAAVGLKWLTSLPKMMMIMIMVIMMMMMMMILPAYFLGPVALKTRYPGIHPTVSMIKIPHACANGVSLIIVIIR